MPHRTPLLPLPRLAHWVRCNVGWVLALLLLLPVANASAGRLLAGEPHDFVFAATGHFADKPVTVHYYKAKSAGPNAQVLIAMHGMERNGKGTRDTWMAFAEKNQLIVLAPELDAVNYPTKLFQVAGMADTDRSHWVFTVVEQLFEQVRVDEGLASATYMLFGHSAGAQFAHRFALMMPHSHASTVVAANAGSYMAPAYPESLGDLRYPWALNEHVLGVPELKITLGRKLIVLLGEADTQTSAPDFPKSREAAQFGDNRLERGKNFYARAKAQADKLATPLAWELHTVPGVGHNSRAMSKAAAEVLFPTP